MKIASLAILALLVFDAPRTVSAQTSQETPLDGLRSANSSVRRKAASDLGKSKPPEALARLAELGA